ncbi:GatB/YqeY domain-containing protein [Nakamurella lactea]|uniref:GatB/YqeY domain-containing protein n=1 Tax=Nakamurella lactea TaxID=459515 RepID=UPI0004234677|nr:GatB/YqeY domain-containing protein [Nakamurella lactea]
MSALKDKIRADLTAAMKARDTLVTGTLRMTLAALTNEEVAGAQARELTDPDVIRVLAREVKKRNESAQVYAGAGRQELADKELAEAEVISGYLPQQLADEELAELVRAAVAEVADGGDAPSMKQMGQVIKAVQAKAAGRADGSRISAAVKAALAG